MSDPLKLYENGVKCLLSELGSKCPDFKRISILQARLYENIQKARDIGVDGTDGRMEIIHELDEITVKYCGQTFLQYCQSKEMTNQPTLTPSIETPFSILDTIASSKTLSTDAHSEKKSTTYANDTLLQANEYLKAVRTVALEATDFFDNPHKLWYERCMAIHASFQDIKSLQLTDLVLSPLRMRLSFIHEQVNTLTVLLKAFCPYCESTQGAQRQRAEIFGRLQDIIKKCEKQLDQT